MIHTLARIQKGTPRQWAHQAKHIPHTVIYFLFIIFWNFCFFLPLPSEANLQFHANPAGSPTRNDMSLQVGEMLDSNPGSQVLQSGALPMSHHIPRMSHHIPNTVIYVHVHVYVHVGYLHAVGTYFGTNVYFSTMEVCSW